MELHVKKSILLLNTLILSVSAFGGTDIIYNSMSRHRENVVAGNIRFGKDGLVDARDVCFDQVNRIYKTTIPAHIEEKCSFKGLIVRLCTQEGGRIITTNIPAKDVTAPEYITVQKCTEFDHSDSAYPKCVKYEKVEKQQPVDFTFMKYNVQLPRTQYDDPFEYEVRDMKVCE